MPESIARGLDRKLAHVLERRMRLSVVRECLLGLRPESACAFLDLVLHRVPPPSPGLDILRDAVLELLTRPAAASDPGDLEPLPYAFRRDVYAAAALAGRDSLARLLRTLPTQEEEAASRLPREIAEIPLGIEDQGRHPVERGFFEKTDTETGLSTAGHAHAERIGGQIS